MKQHKMIYFPLALILSVSVISCAKKKVEKSPDTTNNLELNKDGNQPQPQPQPGKDTPHKGLMTLGGKGSTKIVAMANMFASSDKTLSANLQAISDRFKVETKNEAILKVHADYDVASSKMTVPKATSSLQIINTTADGQAQAVEVATQGDANMKIADKSVVLSFDKSKKEYVAKEDIKDIEYKDATKAVSIKLESNPAVPELSNIALATSLAPVVALTDADGKSINTIVLDVSKGDLVQPEIYFKSSFAGSTDDPAKPLCVMYSVKGIKEAKPIVINNVLDLADQDKKLNFEKIEKDLVEKLEAGETDLQIDCYTLKSDHSPNAVTSTTVKGLKLKIIKSEAKKDESKDKKDEKDK